MLRSIRPKYRGGVVLYTRMPCSYYFSNILQKMHRYNAESVAPFAPLFHYVVPLACVSPQRSVSKLLLIT